MGRELLVLAFPSPGGVFLICIAGGHGLEFLIFQKLLVAACIKNVSPTQIQS
jgi:hypothetical protein